MKKVRERHIWCVQKIERESVCVCVCDRDTYTEKEIKWIELPFQASTHYYNLETTADLD